MDVSILSNQIFVGLISSIVSCITLILFVFKKDCYSTNLQSLASLQSLVSLSVSVTIIFLCFHIGSTLNENSENLNKKIDDLRMEVVYLRAKSYSHESNLKEIIGLCK